MIKNYQSAILDLTKAIKIQPKNATAAYYNKGNIYLELDDNQNAISDYSNAIKLFQKYDKAYINRGVTYKNIKLYDKALKDFDRAIEINYQYELVYFHRTCIFQAQEKYPQAIIDYFKCLELNPKYALALNNKGNSHSALGGNIKACLDLENSIRFEPKDYKTYYNLAIVKIEMKKNEEAIT